MTSFSDLDKYYLIIRILQYMIRSYTWRFINISVRDSYYRIFTAYYRLRYTLLQNLIPSYRFRHWRVIHHFIYQAPRLHSRGVSDKAYMIKTTFHIFLLLSILKEPPVYIKKCKPFFSYIPSISFLYAIQFSTQL